VINEHYSQQGRQERPACRWSPKETVLEQQQVAHPKAGCANTALNSEQATSRGTDVTGLYARFMGILS